MQTGRLGQVGVPAAVVAIVVMMVVPLPPIILDVLLAVNISASVLVLLVSMKVQRPLDFSVFPSLLLVATLFRLALNVSVTRLVLLHGYAGTVVQSFGHFVVGGVDEAAGTVIDVAPANIGGVQFVGGEFSGNGGTDTLWVRASDGVRS